MQRVEHYRKKGLIKNEDDAQVDSSPNPKAAWIDILLALEHEESKHGNGGSGWKSKWDELRDATENLKTSLYMTSSGARDLTASELKLRAMEDSGVKVDELNVAIAHEMWQRADNEGLEAEIRRLLGPLLRRVVDQAKAAFEEAGSGMESPRADSDGMSEDENNSDFGSTNGAPSLEPFMDPDIRMEWFFFQQDKLEMTLGHDYVRRHRYESHRAVVEGLIKIVRDNDDILQPAEVIAAEREGALKSILKHFQIGGVSMIELDRQLELMSNSARTHSETLAGFSTSELYNLGKRERLHRKFVNYKRDKSHIIELLVDHERRQQRGSFHGSLSRKTESVSVDQLESELNRMKWNELQPRGKEVGWVPQPKTNQLTQALDAPFPKKVLVWRLLEASAQPAPSNETSQAVAGGEVDFRPPTRLASWANKMVSDLEKVNSRSEKLTTHTTKLNDKVKNMSKDLVTILQTHGLEDATAEHARGSADVLVLEA